MARRAGVISIDVTAGTGKMVLDLEKGKAALREFGASGKSSMAPTTVALRELEGNLANNTRGVARFLADTLKLGPALNAAFPLIGGVAFAGLLVSLGGKVVDFFKQIDEAPRKITNAFRELNAPLQTANDELRVTNDRLANDIAKLESRHENTLKLALDEARVVADKLAESIEKDIAAVQKLQKENSIGGLKALVSGSARSGEDEDDIRRFSDRIAQLDAEGAAKVRAAKTKSEAQAAQGAWNQESLAVIDAEIRNFEALIGTSQELQRRRQAQGNIVVLGGIGSQNPNLPIADQTQLLAERSGVLANLQALRDRYQLSAENANLQGQKDELTPLAEQRKKDLEETKRLVGEVQRAMGSLAGTAGDAWKKIDIAEEAEIGQLLVNNELTQRNIELVERRFDLDRISVYVEAVNRLNAELGRQREEWTKIDIAAQKVLNEPFSGYRKDIEDGAKKLEEMGKHMERLAAESNRITSTAAANRLRHDIAMVTAGGDQNDPLGALAAQQALQRQDIEDRYVVSLKLAKTALEQSNVIRERALQLQQLQYELEERTAQVRQKGVKDFFLEMQGESETAGHILYDSMHSALDQLSQELSRLFTGQKTNFGQMLIGIGQEIEKNTIKVALQKGLGELGKLAHINKPAPPPVKRPTGNPGDAVHVIVDNNGWRQDGTYTPVPSSSTASQAGEAVSKAPGFFGTLLKHVFGGLSASSSSGEDVSSSITYMAEGGDVDPGKGYIVGDGGEPEFFSPHTSGTITPLHKLVGGGDTHQTVNNIDARGADLGAANRILRALEATHSSAVATSIRANADRAHRTVQRGRN